MKKLIALFTLLASLTAFANTQVIVVRGKTQSEATSKLHSKINSINSRRHLPGCGSNPRVYSATAPQMSYRSNRNGQVQAVWTAKIKVSCYGAGDR